MVCSINVAGKMVSDKVLQRDSRLHNNITDQISRYARNDSYSETP